MNKQLNSQERASLHAAVGELINELKGLPALINKKSFTLEDFCDRESKAINGIGNSFEIDEALPVEMRLRVNALLEKIRHNELARIAQLPSSGNPSADVVTGSPGSGKSHTSGRLMDENPNSFYLCGDKIKDSFKRAVRDDPTLKHEPKLLNDAYIHKITSKVSWSLLRHCVDQRKSFVLEMIGTQPSGDANMIASLVESDYKTSYSHVAAPEREMIKNMILRYFGDGPDAERYVSILASIKMRAIATAAFEDTVQLLSKMPSINGAVQVRMFDNTDRKMDRRIDAPLSNTLGARVEEFIASLLPGKSSDTVDSLFLAGVSVVRSPSLATA